MIDVEAHKLIRNAIKQGELQEVARLINGDHSRLESITPFGTWLHVAAAHGQLAIAKWLIEQGADVNAPGVTTEGAPLVQAASNGHVEVARCLLDSGAVMDVSESVRNPLFAAIYGGHTGVAKLLIEHGIDTFVIYNGERMKNMNARAFAQEWGRTEIVKLLDEKRSGPSG